MAGRVRARGQPLRVNFMKRFATILGLLLALAGCATHRTSSVATVRRDAQNRYEIELHGVEWSAGGPCNFPQMPHRTSMSHWIYTPTLSGVVPADRVILTYERAQTQFPQTDLRGSIQFMSNNLRVSLKCPCYRDDGKIDHYTAYEFNGTYSLVELNR